MLSFILLKIELPIPETFFKSSTALKLPLASRYFIMLLALDSPIPVKVISSSLLAVLMFTFSFWFDALVDALSLIQAVFEVSGQTHSFLMHVWLVLSLFLAFVNS